VLQKPQRRVGTSVQLGWEEINPSPSKWQIPGEAGCARLGLLGRLEAKKASPFHHHGQRTHPSTPLRWAGIHPPGFLRVSQSTGTLGLRGGRGRGGAAPGSRVSRRGSVSPMRLQQLTEALALRGRVFLPRRGCACAGPHRVGTLSSPPPLV
jgi:hypothetical protein